MGAGELDVCGAEEGRGDRNSRAAQRGVRDGVAGGGRGGGGACPHLNRKVHRRARPPWVLDGCQEGGEEGERGEGRGEGAWIQG